MNYRYILAAALSAVIFCGCNTDSAQETVTETTAETTTATTFNEYYLVRGWDGADLLNSIFYCGEYRPLPLSLEKNPDFSFSDGILYLPNGHAEAAEDENGNIISLHFTSQGAPPDFSVYGVDFGDSPADIPSKVGFANIINGDEDTQISYTFTGGGITQLLFEFDEKKLTDIYIIA